MIAASYIIVYSRVARKYEASCCISSRKKNSTWVNPVSESQTSRDFNATTDEMLEVVVRI